jgi:hypothetical protein
MSTPRVLLPVLAVLLSAPAHADSSFLPARMKAVPDLASWRKNHLLQDVEELPGLTDQQKQAILGKITGNLKAQYTALSSVPKPASCAGAPAVNYVYALRATGQHSACVQFAGNCLATADSPLVALVGAQCEADRQNATAAESYFAVASSPKFAAHPDYDQALLENAMYENFGPHPEMVEALLAREPRWDQATRALWKGVIRRAGSVDTGGLTHAQVDKFLDDQIKQARGDLHDLLLSLKIAIAVNVDERLTDGLNLLSDQTGSFRTPLGYYSTAYRAVYEGFGDDFAMARGIYDLYDHFADQWATFPTEENTYNYSELYGVICKANLLQGNDLDNFNQLRANLRAGKLDFNSALTQVEALAGKFSGKADVMATYGSLLSQAGRHDEALKAYWTAHRDCRYYNRANWGLVLEKRYRRYSALPDYAANEAKAAAAVKAIQVPQVTSQYFVNWNSLTSAEQGRVLYGSRIWVPYYQMMFNAKSRVFIKNPSDLLSDTPGLEDIKDERIEGDGHVTDHRLWDDVRGVGGEVVAADASEVFQGVQGDYNLLGHEMTHQFHAVLANEKSPLADCIEGQYAWAKKNHHFPDDYSSVNSKEFFAQGVTYYLVPADSPERFGLNQSWLPKYDPQQFDFIKSIDAAAGAESKIECRSSDK